MTVNKAKNLEYYSSDSVDVCDCGVCKSFILQIREKFPKIAEYFGAINVDILKPFELIWLEAEDNTIDYIGCQYIVFGICEEDFCTEIDGITITNNTDCHPSTNIADEHFILDFGEINMKLSEL